MAGIPEILEWQFCCSLKLVWSTDVNSTDLNQTLLVHKSVEHMYQLESRSNFKVNKAHLKKKLHPNDVYDSNLTHA